MIKQLFAAAALAGIAATSFAAESTASPATAAPAATPFYVGIDGGASKPEYSGTHGSYGIYAGYNFAPNFAVEAGFRRLFDASGWGAHEYADQASLSVIGTLPVTPSFGLYGRLGINQVSEHGSWTGVIAGSTQQFSYSDSSRHLLAGIGASYKLTEKVTARVEAQRVMDGVKNYSAGISYAF